jgi:hypothetical protein
VVVLGPAALVLGLAFFLLLLPCFLLKACQTRESGELESQLTGCVSFWGNALLALCFIPAFVALLVVFFIVTFLQVRDCGCGWSWHSNQSGLAP